jgi:hypothetical protein
MSGDDARTSREVVMTYGNSVLALDATIHRDLKDRMLFLDSQSAFSASSASNGDPLTLGF